MTSRSRAASMRGFWSAASMRGSSPRMIASSGASADWPAIGPRMRRTWSLAPTRASNRIGASCLASASSASGSSSARSTVSVNVCWSRTLRFAQVDAFAAATAGMRASTSSAARRVRSIGAVYVRRQIRGRHRTLHRVFDATLVGNRCRAYDWPIRGRGGARYGELDLLPSEGGMDPMLDQQPTVVSLTDAAASKLQELTKEETNPDIGLRVYVYSGGCSGFRYGMMLEDAPTPEDNILNANGIKVYVDGQSIDLLKGSQIDYVDTLMGAGFTVNNPNAVAAC